MTATGNYLNSWYGRKKEQPAGSCERSARDLAEFTAHAAILHLYDTLGVRDAQRVIIEAARRARKQHAGT